MRTFRRLLRTGLVLSAALLPANYSLAAPQARHSVIHPVEVQRFSVTSSRPFTEVVSRIESGLAHPDLPTLVQKMAEAQNQADLENVVNAAVGPDGLMQFDRFDFGEILRKEVGDQAQPIVRLLVGNPLIMLQMAKTVPDAGSYAPVTILIDQRPDGVHISYDKMTSFLAPYGDKDVLQVARKLDAKVEGLITSAAF
jgi:uncharacterized protein (DUF302 family)